VKEEYERRRDEYKSQEGVTEYEFIYIFYTKHGYYRKDVRNFEKQEILKRTLGDVKRRS
jgi:hypothetical protein